MSLPMPEQRSLKMKKAGVNSTAVCKTDDEILEGMKAKRKRKPKRREILKRELKERGRKQREIRQQKSQRKKREKKKETR